MSDRARAFATAFPRYEAAHPRVVLEQGREVLYATWVMGNDYRTKSELYGAYPKGYLERVSALFPTECGAGGRQLLHAFSGSLPPGDYTRLDLHPSRRPDVIGSVYDVARLFGGQRRFRLVMADPPYSADDAIEYGTPMVDRRRAIAALADVTVPGGFLVWLDCVWPIHRKAQWQTVGRITLIRSTNHRVRLVTIFERTAG